jgi:hypothetical protein
MWEMKKRNERIYLWSLPMTSNDIFWLARPDRILSLSSTFADCGAHTSVNKEAMNEPLIHTLMRTLVLPHPRTLVCSTFSV